MDSETRFSKVALLFYELDTFEDHDLLTSLRPLACGI